MRNHFFTAALITVLVFFLQQVKAQVAINTDGSAPHSSAILDLKSLNKGLLLPRVSTPGNIFGATPGLMVFDESQSKISLFTNTGWSTLNPSKWNSGASNSLNYSAGNVGIGTTSPTTKLHVLGDTKLQGFTQINGSAELGGSLTCSSYGSFDGSLYSTGLSLTDGTFGLSNTADNITWYNYYDSSADYYAFSHTGYGSTPQLSIKNNGNVAIQGAATVNNNKGVAYNSGGSANLKMFPFTTAVFHAIIPGNSAVQSGIIFSGGFTSTPRVFVGDIDTTTDVIAGDPNRVIMVLHSCALDANTGNTGCSAKLINTSPNPVNYKVTYNCFATGF